MDLINSYNKQKGHHMGDDSRVASLEFLGALQAVQTGPESPLPSNCLLLYNLGNLALRILQVFAFYDL